MSIQTVQVAKNRQSSGFGVDGRYLYVRECDAEFELIVGNSAPLRLNKNDDVDLKNNFSQDLIIRVRDVSGLDQIVEIESSHLPFTKQRLVKVSPDSVVSLAEDTRVGIDPDFNEVKVIGQVTQEESQHSAKVNLLGSMRDILRQIFLRSSRASFECKVISGEYTIKNAVHFSVYSLDKTDYEVGGQLIPYTVATNAPELVGSKYNDVVIKPADGKKLMLMEVR